MATERVESLISELVGLTEADPNTVRVWLRDGFRELVGMRRWSFLHQRSAIVVPASVSTTSLGGVTAAVDQDSPVVTLSSAVVSSTWLGRQFRINQSQYHDIVEIVSSSKFKVRPEWNLDAVTASAFSITRPYAEMPRDFLMPISVVDTTIQRALHLGYQRELLDLRDANRTKYSNTSPRLLCPLDWSRVNDGTVDAPLRVQGSGTRPLAGGAFTGQSDALFTVTVTTGGLGSAVVFKWSKDEGSYTTGVAADTTAGNSLQDGVVVRFDATATYTVADTFIIRTFAATKVGVVRQEVYPCPTSRTVLPMIYVSRHPDITDDNVELPGLFAERTDILIEKVLEYASAEPRKPYSQVSGREYHAGRCLLLMRQLEIHDELLMPRDALLSMPPVDLPWGYDDPRETDPVDMYPGGAALW